MLNLYVKLSLMKRLFLLLFAVTAFSSCTKHYMQLATLSSDSVFLDEGCYVYKDDNIAIDYLFNTDDGVFEFAVLNISDGDIYIDLEKSVFVYNSQVYDYAGRETSVTAFSEISKTYANAFISSSGHSAFGYSSSHKNGVSKTSLTRMPSVVLIPKGTCRIFSGFDINSTLYRQLFFARDPKPDENVCIYGDEINNPISFSNVLFVETLNNEYTVENNFKVDKIRNVRLSSSKKLSILPSEYYILYSEHSFSRGYTDDIYGSFYYDDRSYQTSDLIEATDGDVIFK